MTKHFNNQGATTASNVWVTDSNGLPSWSATLPSGLAATNLTLTTPALGTPSSGTLTNCTGLPVAGGGTGNSTFTAYSVICAGTTATGIFQNVSGVGSSGQVLTSNGASALPTWQAVGGGTTILVQRVSTTTGAFASGTTVLPFDDTIPQNTEGDQYMTLAITPLNTAHILVIDVWLQYDASTNTNCSMALFQDSTANALAAAGAGINGAGVLSNGFMRWIMTAGTTSSTTFKLRAGVPTSGSFYFNGVSGARLFGGVSTSGMIITEYTA